MTNESRLRIRITKMMDAWERGENDAVSMEAGLEQIGKMITAMAQAYDRSYYPAMCALAALVPIYTEHGTDPDGIASQNVYMAFELTGWRAK